MLSKQDKLKYGQELRRQMKEKQEKKRVQDMQKRGMKKSPTDIRINIEPQQYIDNKQNLQNRFQSQSIQYYGRPGGGAPNRQNNQQSHASYQPQYNNLDQNQFVRLKTSEDYQNYPPSINQQIIKQNNSYVQQRNPQQFDYYPRNGSIDNAQFNQGIQNQNFQQFQNPANFVQAQQQYYSNNYNQGYGQAYNQNMGPQMNRNPQRIPQERFIQQQPQYQMRPPNIIQQKQQYQIPYNEIIQQPMKEISQKHEQYRQKGIQNDELMQIHKKGGRNLLQLQNMTIDQQQIKQKQKQQMRKQLQLQMKEAQQRKKQQQDKLRRQEEQQFRKNQEYIQLQKRRFEEEQRKKNQKQRELIQQNARNLQERRKLEEEAKQKALRQKMKQSIPQSNQQSPRIKQKGGEVFSRQVQYQAPADDTTSQASSLTAMEKDFHPSVSKQYYENERRKQEERFMREKNLESVTEEIKKLKQHIDKQNQLFKNQIQKVKLQSEMAEQQKRKAQQQIQNLKLQLKKKMEDDNQRLFMALQRQQSLVKQQQYDPPGNRRAQKESYKQSFESLKPNKDEKLIKKQYVVNQNSPKKQAYNPKLLESNVSNQSDEGMLHSLHGDSKKVPINLPDDKLSISRLSEYARQTSFFKNEGKSPNINKKKSTYVPHESIIEQDQDRSESRAIPRNQIKQKNYNNHKDELDRFVESKPNKKEQNSWGEMSSVNSDITKQIQQLLKKKDNPYRPPSSTKYDNQQYYTNQRPNSKLSNAGKQSLVSNGFQYDGASLGTINSIANDNGTLGTYDLDRINNRNEKRLNQLRNLGVQTINTNGDDQFSKLDMILNKYKQSRVM